MRINAPAKINLNLLVASRRGDGFHPLDSFVTKITFYDWLEMRPRRDGLISLICEGIDCGETSENLAIRAAKILAEGRAVGGVDILLRKEIPPGGGLGGGSSDAAAVLIELNKLWNLNLPDDQLADIAAELGSDVPLFLGQAGSRITGRGEILQPVKIYPLWVILILPDIACPTGEVYRAFDAAPPQADKQLDSKILTQPPSKWRSMLVNHLESPAMQLAPDLANIQGKIAAATSLPVNLSGSGSTLFILCDNQAETQMIVNLIPQEFQKYCRIARLNEW